jgi:hypothetical protein
MIWSFVIEIKAGDANTVCAMVMKVLQEYKIALGQLIGVCSDGASTMRGVHRGVCTQLERDLRQGREATIHHIIANQDANNQQKIHGIMSCL